MSTTAHCLYCIEVLSASLEGRAPLDLFQVETSWLRYTVPTVDKRHDSQVDRGDATISKNDSLVVPNSDNRSSSPSPTTISGSSSGAASSPVSIASSQTSLSARTPAEEPHYPLFVTWNAVNSNGARSLRGCIGTFDAQPLETGLKSYSLTSAFDDNRFSPIAPHELPNLSCSVTLLTDFEHISSPMDWEIGKHGLRIYFVYKSRRYGSTYLPDVAKEQGWTKLETIISLMRKAGWNGRREDWDKVSNMSVTRYQGLATSADYAKWRAWKDWTARERV